jgi:hypothetical protein
VLLISCRFLIPSGSGGGSVTHHFPKDAAASGFVWQYENWIEFDRELTITVDSVFARLKAKDGDVQRAVDDFRAPAYRVLNDNYGINLVWGSLEADFQSRKFVLKTHGMPWPSDDIDGAMNRPQSPMLALPASKQMGASYRWRARVAKCEVEFNSLSSKRVFVHAEIFVEIQERLPKGQWKMVQLNDTAMKTVGDSLRKDLNRAYYRYMKDRYGFEVTSFRFGGLNE